MKLPWGKKEDVQRLDEYTEVPMELEEGRHVKIMIEKLENYAGVDSVIRKVREGNIVIAKIKELKEYCINDVKVTKEVFDYGIENGRVHFLSKIGNQKKDLEVDWKKYKKPEVSAEMKLEAQYKLF